MKTAVQQARVLPTKEELQNHSLSALEESLVIICQTDEEAQKRPLAQGITVKEETKLQQQAWRSFGRRSLKWVCTWELWLCHATISKHSVLRFYNSLLLEPWKTRAQCFLFISKQDCHLLATAEKCASMRVHTQVGFLFQQNRSVCLASCAVVRKKLCQAHLPDQLHSVPYFCIFSTSFTTSCSTLNVETLKLYFMHYFV